MHSTNSFNRLILPAEDCRAAEAKIPDKEGTIAALQYAMIQAAPYAHTSDDVICAVQARRKGVADDDLDAFRTAFFAKGQACLRASPLTKTHGWAIHSDAAARVALIDPASPRFRDLLADDTITKTRAMRNTRG